MLIVLFGEMMVMTVRFGRNDAADSLLGGIDGAESCTRPG
jgi:hypothetical protein